jgi:ArsR family transcriptional regulator
VIAVDESREMLAAARRRLAERGNVDLRHGPLEAVPIETGALDAAVMMLVLHHLVDPTRALHEAARVVRPGGRLLVVDMAEHGREEYRERMGHVWLGFGAEQMAGWLEAAGFEMVRVRRLRSDPEAKGPLLLAASGTRGAAAAHVQDGVATNGKGTI